MYIVISLVNSSFGQNRCLLEGAYFFFLLCRRLKTAENKIWKMNNLRSVFFSPVARWPSPDLDHLIVEVSRRHSHTPHSVRLLWTRVRPVARPVPENTTFTRDRYQTSMLPAGFELTFPAIECPQSHTLDREPTWAGV